VKCAACGHDGEDFQEHQLDVATFWSAEFYSCPKCGTLRVEVLDDEK